MSSPSPPLFSSSADPELQPPSIRLPLAQVPSSPPPPVAEPVEPPTPLPVILNDHGASPAAEPLISPDSDDDDLAAPPITLSASVVLDNIPRDSRVALANAFMPNTSRVNVRLLSVGNTPGLQKKVFKVTASQKFSFIVRFLRKQLGLKDSNGQSLFVYVNSTFAPSLDEEIGNLYKCFKREDELVVNYCLTPAFG